MVFFCFAGEAQQTPKISAYKVSLRKIYAEKTAQRTSSPHA
jgi:hypothetical protein